MTVEEKYRKQGEAAFASYDFSDIASATGIETFYAGKANANSVLSNIVFYSDKVVTNASISSTSYTLGADVDFDVELNAPRTLRGTAIINVPHGVKAGSPSITWDTYIVANIKKWDGTTETHIVSGASLVTSAPLTSAGDYVYAMGAIFLDVPRTTFKKGETLRLNIENFGKNNGPNAGDYFIGHDPKDRGDIPQVQSIVFGSQHSILTALIPFAIDL